MGINVDPAVKARIDQLKIELMAFYDVSTEQGIVLEAEKYQVQNVFHEHLDSSVNGLEAMMRLNLNRMKMDVLRCSGLAVFNAINSGVASRRPSSESLRHDVPESHR